MLIIKYPKFKTKLFKDKIIILAVIFLIFFFNGKSISAEQKPQKLDPVMVEHQLENNKQLTLINLGIPKKADSAVLLAQWKNKKTRTFNQENPKKIYLNIFIIILAVIFLISFYWIRKLKKLKNDLNTKINKKTKKLNETNKKLKELNEKLEELSLLDSLTGIYNRKYFINKLKEFWNINLRAEKPISLIIINIDDFKEYSNNFGHQEANRVFKDIAQLINKTAQRSGDLTARFGAQEFVVLSINSRENEAVKLAEKIRDKIINLYHQDNNLKRKLTVSIGCAAVIPKKSINTDKLIKAAEKALNKAKKETEKKIVKASSLL